MKLSAKLILINLFHTSKSSGCFHAKSRSTMQSGKKTNKRAWPKHEQRHIKVGQCPPQSIFCCEIADSKSKGTKIFPTTIYWSTYPMSLYKRKLLALFVSIFWSQERKNLSSVMPGGLDKLLKFLSPMFLLLKQKKHKMKIKN